jgi:hypothetical protein
MQVAGGLEHPVALIAAAVQFRAQRLHRPDHAVAEDGPQELEGLTQPVLPLGGRVRCRWGMDRFLLG